MVRLRLRKMGSKNQPSYRIIAADKESPRDGRFLEILGFYNPRTEPFTIKVEEGKVYQYLGTGAQPTESVAQLFKSVGLTERYARMKAGEPLEVLLAEAEIVYQKHTQNPKTRQDTV